jgi:hypothetical protein
LLAGGCVGRGAAQQKVAVQGFDLYHLAVAQADTLGHGGGDAHREVLPQRPTMTDANENAS